MMAAVLLALAIASGLASGVGFVVLGQVDMTTHHDDPTETRERRSTGVKAFFIGVAGLIAALALAFAAGRV